MRSTSPTLFPGARLLRHVYSHFRLTHQNQIAYFWLKKADFTRTGADSCDSEGLIDHIPRHRAGGGGFACSEEIEPDLTRISLRSKSDHVNVNENRLRSLGGRGHSGRGGARIAGSPLSPPSAKSSPPQEGVSTAK